MASAQTTAAPAFGSTSAEVIDTCVANLKSLYSKDTAAQNTVVDSAYASHAVFEDNLLHAEGVNNIKAQFHALAKCFKSVSLKPGSTEVVSSGEDGHVVKVTNEQEYLLGTLFGTKPIVLEVDTYLHLDNSRRIVMHKDEWKGTYANWGWVKSLVGSSSSMLFRMMRL